ncbi:SLBB domain-containing protein [Gammaproteobacteria bacterium]|nr:SLBB domain-containing protein [Gammaproteobacteria bacterium]
MNNIIKSIFLIIFFIPLVIIGQEEQFDKAYLESLPESVREDVLSQVKQNSDDEEILYRRPSSMTKKPIKYDDNGDEIIPDRFGMQIFDMMQTSFMPINEPNLDSSYILDFGDVLELQTIGQDSSIERMLVKRDGSINIPDLGKVVVSGLSLSQAYDLIKSKINTAFIGTDAYVTLVEVRDIQVLISGNAYNPGLYTLNGNSNPLHALSMAGGVDELGSFRKIDVIRDGKVINSIDLYDIFVFGKPSYGSRLKSGDSLFINPAKKIVQIYGGVNREGQYELKGNESLQDLLNFSNGLKYNANGSSLVYEKLEKETIISNSITIDDLGVIIPNAGDTLFVSEYNYRSVEIIGAVNTPGKYTINDGDTISDVIKRAGGYRNDAYTFGGILENKRALEINEKSKELLYKKFINSLINKGAFALETSSSLPIIMKEMKDTETSGRVQAEFDLDILESNKSLETLLEDEDKIIIPYITQQVYIHGQVQNPGTKRYVPGKNLDYYIQLSGGDTEDADPEHIFVVQPNGDTIAISDNSWLRFLNEGNNNVPIYPGTVIFIPRSSNLTTGSQIAAIWAPIVSSLALTLTSLSVLDKN